MELALQPKSDCKGKCVTGKAQLVFNTPTPSPFPCPLPMLPASVSYHGFPGEFNH